ncbi:GntR family transcriptional regulator [Sphingomonas canadensis]|uniref:GntR family transcriptional regulator n=1 Tax=Sphingomonas canadensis TaxID=1219257 RepID=A0ABW3HAC1_9SPHN|nr:GntR family transcriptional regulator [Sphingomonas canadensis]MCW3838108.1 GntR family transcriptional regulator [Sphingomonas canadensis]
MNDETSPPRRRARARLDPPVLGAIDPSLDVPIGQQIYRALRRALMAGRISAGDRLSIRAIADSLGVSPAPVRDALKQLEANDVLEARQKSAFFTPPIDPEGFAGLQRVRVELEGFAAAEAARNADARDLRAIDDAADRYLDALGTNPSDSVAANHAFHFAVYHASHNPVLVQLIEVLWLRMGPLLATAEPSYDHSAARGHHREAVRAIHRRDADAAAAAIRGDILEACDSIRAALFG